MRHAVEPIVQINVFLVVFQNRRVGQDVPVVAEPVPDIDSPVRIGVSWNESQIV